VSENLLLADRIGHEDLWPLDPRRLAEDTNTFFDVIELLHDLVSRPRTGWFHTYCDCGWHYSDFSRSSGVQLYRWHVNRLRSRSNLGLRLAADGEEHSC
jgi:hypothetical protein